VFLSTTHFQSKATFTHAVARLEIETLEKINYNRCVKPKAPCTSNVQVAKQAGVHATTVSRALRGDRQIPFSTRQRIKKIARQLGYSVDPLVSSLAKRQRKSGGFRGSLAWIDNFPTQNGSQKIDAFREYFEGAQARATELGFKLEPLWLGDKKLGSHRVSSVLRTRNIQGLLLAPQPHSYRPLPLQWEGFSIVTFGYSLTNPVFHMVTNHQYHTMISAFRHILSLGYRRIGFAMSLEDNIRTKYNQLAGFLVEEYHVAPKDRIPPFIVSEFTFEQFSKWYQKYEPKAVITQYFKIYDWLALLGVKIPQDIGFVDLSLRENEAFVSGLSQQNEKVGKTAVDFLVSLIERNERGIPKNPLNLLCESRWLPGMTLRRVNR
jgi:DNA-binding LacI/PurR family transcriptional regulator